MNWINEYVRPRINSLFSRRDMPENLWRKCDECGTMLFHRELTEALNVCPNCQHHMALSPRDRFQALFDGGLFSEIAFPEPLADPLQFRDEKRYPDRLRDARRKTGEHEAVLAAEGEIGRLPVICLAQDFAFMGGSMGMAVGNAMIAAAERAVKRRAPLVVFSAAGGARMQEGILSLMQMPRTTVAVQMVKEAGLPYVVVLTNPTTGGVTASYAMLGDVQIAEPGALICFAGPRVIEQTIRETLPEGFQRAEYLLDHGMLDRVTHRKDMRDELASLLRLLMSEPPRIHGDLPGPEAESLVEAVLPAEAAAPSPASSGAASQPSAAKAPAAKTSAAQSSAGGSAKAPADKAGDASGSDASGPAATPAPADGSGEKSADKASGKAAASGKTAASEAKKQTAPAPASGKSRT